MMNLEKKNKPQMARRLICLAMITIVMMGVSGCMFQSSEQRVAPKMLQYMEEKYGEEFVLAEGNFMSGNFAGTAVSLWLNPVSHPEWNVTVRYTPGEPFSDNYVGFLKMDEVHDYLKPYFDEVYGEECRLFVNKPTGIALPDDFNRNTDAETYLEVRTISIDLYVAKDVSTRDIDAQKLWNLEALYGFTLYVRVYYFSDEAFNSEETQIEQDSNNLPYLCFGNIILARQRGSYKEVTWREATSTSSSIN